MNPRRRLIVVEVPSRDELAGVPGGLGVGVREIARRDGNVDEGQHSLRGVELAPGRPRV